MSLVRRSIPGAALLLLLLAPPVLAAEGDPFSPAFRQCMEKAAGGTQAERACLFAETSDWDRKLTERYGQLMQARTGEDKASLQTAQRLWLKFRDANCRVKSQPPAGQPGGPGSVNAMAYCLMRMTIVRAHELLELD